MNPTRHALRLGVRRGITEFGISMRNPGDVSYAVLGVVILAVMLVIFRDTQFGSFEISTAVYIIASALAVQVVFIATYGAATQLAVEREDGTLLRAKSLPHGLRIHSTGLLTRTLLEFGVTTAVSLIVIVIIVGPQLELTPAKVALFFLFIFLGLAACLPFGFVLGSVFRNPRVIGGWGFLVVGALAWLAGLIQPLITLPAALQMLGQTLPLYWLGLGVRSTVMPDAMQAIEITGDWRTGWAVVVLTAWAIVGTMLAPKLLSRMARRESSSSLADRRQAALQRA